MEQYLYYNSNSQKTDNIELIQFDNGNKKVNQLDLPSLDKNEWKNIGIESKYTFPILRFYVTIVENLKNLKVAINELILLHQTMNLALLII